MTVDTTSGVPVPDDDTGLGDFDVNSEGVMPRINIDHNFAKWKLNTSEQPFDKLRIIPLGLVKQRILWETTDRAQDNQPPLCKSVDSNTGNPDYENFPWDVSTFEPEDYQVTDGRGNINLPCSACQLKEWGSHPNGNNPWCSLQYTFPVLVDLNNDSSDPQWMPAIMTIQKTGIKPAKNFITPYAASKTPLYVDVVEMGLESRMAKGRPFAVPIFTKTGEKTDSQLYGEYSRQYKTMRAFLTTPPNNATEDDDPGQPEAAVTAATAPAVAAPAPAPAPTPTPAPAPAPAPAPTTRRTPPPRRQAAPAAPQASAPAPAPQQAAPAPAPEQPAAQNASDELPF